MSFKSIICGGLYFLFSALIFANDFGEISFETVGDNSSIPYSVVTEVFQDEQGFIWIGTQRGLIRFDGYHYKQFKHTKDNVNEISGNFISKVTQSQNGYLWIGTKNDGISVFNPDKEIFTFFKHSAITDFSLAHNQVNDILIDKDNGKWIATPNGLNYQEAGKEGFKLFKNGLSSSHTTALFIDNNEKFWVGTKQGLFVFNTQLQKFDLYKDNKADTSIYANLSVSIITQSDNGDIWVGTKDKGLVVLSNTNGDMVLTHIEENEDIDSEDYLSNPWVSSILQVSSERMWVAMFGGGIDIVNTTTRKVVERIKHDISIPDSINLNSVSKLMLDHSGLLWVGTWGGGLNKYDSQQNTFRALRYSPTKKLGLSDANILSILELQDGRWLMGTAENGIDIFNASLQRIGGIRHKANQKNSLPQDVISSLAQTSDGKVWIGTVNHGLYKLDLLTFKLTNFRHAKDLKIANIYRIINDQGKLWIGTRFGPYHFDPDTNTFTELLSENKSIKDRINSIAIDSKQNVWLGSSNGLYFKKSESEQAIHLTHDENDKYSISSNQVTGLLIDSKDRVWIDTGAGLDRFKSLNNGKWNFESISDQMNKPGYYFGGNLLEDNSGKIWTQWNFLNPDSNELIPINGAIGPDVGTIWLNSFAKSKSGLLLFGGTKGVLIISPQNFVQRNYSPPLAITDFSIDGKQSALASTNITIPPNSQRFSIEFTAFDYFKPYANKYKYMLEGYNSDWVYSPASNRLVTFTNLPIGEYRLQLAGSGPSGIWSQNNIKLTVVVEPAFYQTIMFRLALITIFCSFLFVIYILRVNQLKKRQYALEKKVIHRTNELKLSNRNLKVIAEIGQEITSTKDLTSVLDKIYIHISQLMDAYIFNIGIYNKNQKTLNIALSVKDGMKLSSYERDMKNKHQLSVWCIENNKSILITDADIQLSQYIDTADNNTFDKDNYLTDVYSAQSHLYIPLNLNTEVIGMIAVHSLNKNAFGDTQLEIIKMLATYAAIAIDNANKLDQIKLANQSLISAQSELKDSYYKMQEISELDQLTGLNNRHFLTKRISIDVKKTLRDHRKSALSSNTIVPDDEDMIFFLIDLDHFKRINDTYGHKAGDQILKSMKDILSSIFRESDYLIRWGGEEFLVIARFTNREKAAYLAERIRSRVENYMFEIDGKGVITQTCSIGFACFPFIQKHPDKVSWEQVIEVADVCLYGVKNTQRNAWIGLYSHKALDTELFMARLIDNPKALLIENQISLESSIEDNVDIHWKCL
jgi:diguanylate cyclase (GGDEF)-like protein